MPKVSLIGTAHIHAPGFIDTLKRRGVEIVHVYDHDRERAERRVGQIGGGTATTDLQTALKDIDAAVVLSETDRHEDLVMAVVEAGLPLLVEKPLGFAKEDAARMAEAIDAKGLTFSTGYFMRGSGNIRWLHERVKDGWFGTVTRARASNCHSGALGGWFDTEWRWMADPKVAGCGAFGDLGTHVLDLLLMMFGEVESATAALGHGTGRYEDCDEYGEGLLKFKNGVIATFAAGWDDVANPVSFLISGTKGHAMILDGKLVAKGEGHDGEVTDAESANAGLEAFIDALEGKPAELVSPKEAAERNAVMAALYRGAAENRFVAP